jgi:predicted enzyme related to lactoylglutathione lyase
MPKSPVPGMGYMAVCKDSENNGFGILKRIKLLNEE